jgi:signal transduction histidine kinase
LRSPLHTVIRLAELLAEEKERALNDKQKHFVGHIRKDPLLLNLINDLLDLGKIDAGRLELRY